MIGSNHFLLKSDNKTDISSIFKILSGSKSILCKLLQGLFKEYPCLLVVAAFSVLLCLCMNFVCFLAWWPVLLLGKANDKCTTLTTESMDERSADATTQRWRHVYLQVRKFNILHETMILLVPKNIHTHSTVKIE